MAKPFFGNACAICGSAITVHQQVRSGVCDEAKCRHEALLDELRRQKAAARAALEILVAEHHQTMVAKMGLGRIGVAMVPASERRVVKLPRKRRWQFQIALAKLVQRTFLARRTGGKTTSGPEEQPRGTEFMPERSEFQAGCAICRGHCCRLGAPLAFLDADTMQRVQTLHPQLNARQTLRWYLSKIPRRSIEYSCVYHGDRGCTLPRSMRASICNTYHCEGLKALGAKLDQHAIEPILLVATTEHRVVRSALYNPLDKK